MARKSKKSLRNLLILWFLAFSIVPMGLVAIYSFLQFQKALDKEVSQRLRGNVREIESILLDHENQLIQSQVKIKNNPSLLYHLSISEVGTLKALTHRWIQDYPFSRMNLFNRDGRMILSTYYTGKGELKDFLPEDENIFLLDKTKQILVSGSEYLQIESVANQKLSLVCTSRIIGNNGKVVGYLEEVIDLDRKFVESLKSKMNLEVLLLSSDGTLTAASHPDFYYYKKDFFQSYLPTNDESFFEIKLKAVPLLFLNYKAKWKGGQFYILIGAPKGEVQNVLKNLKVAFISIFLVVIALLFLTLLVTITWVLKPLNELVEAIQSFEASQGVVNIPVRSETEVGLLTRSFNQLSQKVFYARQELQKKVRELEEANKELKDTQARLVHSGKMVSLGQLVAGVAHELNNPIGFIYSNMGHLKDYSEKLIQLIGTAESDPKALVKLKEELEFDYIVQDLPKLILSCQDGARRTRDIVLGLRNFSRLEEAQLSEVDIHQSLDATLSLLGGETKNRVHVRKSYGKIPNIKGYSTQINQVFMNLLSNAVQAIDGPGQVWITTIAMGEKVQISIQDSGKGITSENLQHIFDPFFTTKPIGQGTGLGLSISYGIVHNHGGEIQVRSELGIGTEFNVVLPMIPPTSSKP